MLMGLLLLLLSLMMGVVVVVVVMGITVMMGFDLVFVLGQDLLTGYPPALTVVFGEQRLVVPFGGFG